MEEKINTEQQGWENLTEEDDYGQLVFKISKNDRYDPATPVYISKANKLIKRMGNVSLLSEQALLLALAKVKKRSKKDLDPRLAMAYSKIKERSGTDFSEGIIASFSSSELKSFMNIKSSRYYSEINNLMNNREFFKSWFIMYTDSDGRMYDTNLITACAYDKNTGKILVKFNGELEQDILDLQQVGGYTKLNSSIMRVVSKDITTWSIYQLFREEISYIESVNRKKGFPDKKEYMTEFGLAQFKFLISVNRVNLSSSDSGQQACAQYIKERDYEEAELVLPSDSRGYPDWRDFKQRVLGRACRVINGWDSDGCYEAGDEGYEELCRNNHPTDLHFRCEPVKQGTGGKVTALRFYIRWDKEYGKDEFFGAKDEEPDVIEDAFSKNDVKEKKHGKDELDIDDVIDAISELTGRQLKTAEMRRIALAADLDMEKIKAAIKSAYGIPGSHDLFEDVMEVLEGRKNAKYPGFTSEECERITKEALVHKPEEEDPEEWERRYVGYYLSKIQDTSEETKTTEFKRLMDCLRRDYDNIAKPDMSMNPEKSRKNNMDYEQRTYTDEEYLEFERKKLGISSKNKK